MGMIIYIFLIFKKFLAVPCGIRDLSSLTILTPPALEGRTLNHWTAREVPEMIIIFMPRDVRKIEEDVLYETLSLVPHIQ